MSLNKEINQTKLFAIRIVKAIIAYLGSLLVK